MWVLSIVVSAHSGEVIQYCLRGKGERALGGGNSRARVCGSVHRSRRTLAVREVSGVVSSDVYQASGEIVRAGGISIPIAVDHRVS